jgi:hypothetical protein
MPFMKSMQYMFFHAVHLLNILNIFIEYNIKIYGFNKYEKRRRLKLKKKIESVKR